MKKIISLVKKGVRAYFNQYAKLYAFMPTGTIPTWN